MIKYQIVSKTDGLGHKNNLFKNHKQLKEFVAEIINKDKSILLNETHINEFFAEDNNKNLVFLDDLHIDTEFYISTYVLRNKGMELFRVYDDYKIKIDFMVTVPYGKYDMDIVLRIDGFNELDKVSKIELYVDDKHIANYGSYSCGEQNLYGFKDDKGDFVPLDYFGDSTNTSYDEVSIESSSDLVKLIEKENIEDEVYVEKDFNSWFEVYFTAIDGTNLALNNELLQAQCEFIHESIGENIELSSKLVQEIKDTQKWL